MNKEELMDLSAFFTLFMSFNHLYNFVLPKNCLINSFESGNELQMADPYLRILFYAPLKMDQKVHVLEIQKNRPLF